MKWTIVHQVLGKASRAVVRLLLCARKIYKVCSENLFVNSVPVNSNLDLVKILKFISFKLYRMISVTICHCELYF